MNDQAFLADIREHIDDDAPRLVYADWLDDQGQSARAEFIRLECALARLGAADARRRPLWQRDLELIAAYKEEWFGPFRHRCGYWECRRGFIDEVHTSAEALLDHAEEVFRRHAVRHLGLRLGSVATERVAECPHLAWVRVLGLSGNDLGDVGAGLLAGSPHLARLTTLELARTNIGPAGAEALAGSPHLARLVRLDLAGNVVGRAGALALVSSPHLTNLASLELGTWNQVNVGDAGVVALAGCPAAAKLHTLGLAGNNLSAAGFRALVESPYLTGLAALRLAGNHPTEEERQALQQRFGWRVSF
jgi:uncharacterized protein (TIGR02996 family)